jgi:hypothetical protein
MMAKRTPPPASKPQPSLPHDRDREGGQPYAKEVEDYKSGVASTPTVQVGHPTVQVGREAHQGKKKIVRLGE